MYKAFIKTVIDILPTVILITISIKAIQFIMKILIGSVEVKEEQKEDIKKKNEFLKLMNDLYKVFG